MPPIREFHDTGIEVPLADLRHDRDGEGSAAAFIDWSDVPLDRLLQGASQADGNTVFVRDRLAVETRVRDSKRYRLINGMI